MARDRSFDFQLNHRFHLYDISPSLGFYPFVFNPSGGFSSISAPNLQFDVATISPGNAYYAHRVIKKGTTNSLTLARGAVLDDGDFWRWYIAALTGDPGDLLHMSGQRRNMLLVHFGTSDPKRALLSDVFPNKGHLPGGVVDYPGAIAYGLLAQIPSRAWLLFDCLPGGYKPASDFDAKSAEVSLRELTLWYGDIDEIDLAI